MSVTSISAPSIIKMMVEEVAYMEQLGGVAPGSYENALAWKKEKLGDTEDDAPLVGQGSISGNNKRGGCHGRPFYFTTVSQEILSVYPRASLHVWPDACAFHADLHYDLACAWRGDDACVFRAAPHDVPHVFLCERASRLGWCSVQMRNCQN